jgi:mono/diheme cytochrome c family protein
VAASAKLSTKNQWATALVAAAVLIGAAYIYFAISEPNNDSASFSAAAADRLIEGYCIDCHNNAEFTANLTLEGHDLAAVEDDAEMWESVIRKLRAGMMPPPGLERPAVTDYAAS